MFLETKREGEIETKPAVRWRELLLDGAGEMQRRGHCRHEARDDKGRVCFIGALCEAHPNFRTELLDIIIAEFVAMTGQRPVDYSDTHTGPEVIAAMRACANS